jgi:biotin carboxylase
MKTIVFIGTQKSGSSRDGIKSAEKLGYYTVLLTDRTSFIEKRDQFPDVHLMKLLDLSNMEEIRNCIKGLFLKALEICAIVSFVDPHCYSANLLAQEFGLGYFDPKAVLNMQDKILSRQVLASSTYAPRFLRLTNGTVFSQKEIEASLPLILKSPNSTGSKDVILVNTYSEFQDTKDKLLNKYPGLPILVEEFLEGPQYLVEAIVQDNKVTMVAVIEQEITFCKRFIVTGYLMLKDMERDFYESLKRSVTKIIELHGLSNGACHLEMRYVKNQWKLIEVNPRISGAGMNQFVKIGRGIDLIEETLKLILREKADFNPRFEEHVFSQYVTVSQSGILAKVLGKNVASRCPGVKVVYVKPKKGSIIRQPLSMGDRYAYVIATGKNDEDAKLNAKYAASQIQFSLLQEDYEQGYKQDSNVQ